MIKKSVKFIKKHSPAVLKLPLKEFILKTKELPLKSKMALMRWRLRSKNRERSFVEKLDGFNVYINDSSNFYVLYKDVFINKIYHFDADKSDPLILDCGSNIGMTVLYFKKVYPKARIIAFEPDPVLIPYLKKNIEDNKLMDVRIVNAALTNKNENLIFYGDGKYSGTLEKYSAKNLPENWKKYTIPSARLKDYLKEEVDFLKMNIEGAEFDVLNDAGEQLKKIKEMVIEYHHFPHLPRTLHKILELLDKNGFEYLINDFDEETNSGVRPPFKLDKNSKYFLLIYAKRKD